MAAVWAETFASFDKDGDGRISTNEFGAVNQKMALGNGDADKDNHLSQKEWVAMVLGQPPRFQRDLHQARPRQSGEKERLKNVVQARTASDLAKLETSLGSTQRVPERAGPPNILVVGMDTTRADHLSPYGYKRDTTPHLNALAKRGVVFERAYANSNESLYSHTNLWTGRYASEVARPVYQTFFIPDKATTLAEVLSIYGYDTGGFVAGGHLDADFGHSQGFRTYEAQVGFGSFWSTVPQALEWIDGRAADTPWMAFVHGYDAHAPYQTSAPFGHRYYSGKDTHPFDKLMKDPMLPERIYKRAYYPGHSVFFQHPKGFKILSLETYTQVADKPGKQEIPLSTDDVAHMHAHYDGCLAYADLQVGLLIAAIEERGLLENTLVLVIGDHGEDLLDHEYVNHRTGLYDSIIHVPMIAVGPGFEAGQRVQGMVEALDFLPTLLRTAGAQRPAMSRGRALQDVASGAAPALHAVFSEGVMDMLSVRTETHKLIARGFTLAMPDLPGALSKAPLTSAHFAMYDLRTDPGEKNDLLKAPSLATQATGEKLRTQLVAWRTDLKIGAAQQSPSKVDWAVAEELRRHGYWKKEN